MVHQGKLVSDPLFLGLTRPPMFLGVSYMFVLLNMLGCVLYFINTSDLKGLFVTMPAIHLIGYLITLKEPLFIELFMVKGSKCLRCKNRLYHGANSYDPF
jgi:type IV secretion system protein VirB3